MVRSRRKTGMRFDPRLILVFTIIFGIFLGLNLTNRNVENNSPVSAIPTEDAYRYPSSVTITDEVNNFKKFQYSVNGIGYSFLYLGDWDLDFIDPGYGSPDSYALTTLKSIDGGEESEIYFHIGFRRFSGHIREGESTPSEKADYYSTYGSKIPKIIRQEDLIIDGHTASLIEGEFYYEYDANYVLHLFLNAKKARKVQRDKWYVEPAEFEVRLQSRGYSPEKEALYKKYSNQIISTLKIMD